MIFSDKKKLPSENELQSHSNQSQDETLASISKSEIEVSYEGLPTLTTEEAHELAKARGFTGNRDSFRSGITRPTKPEEYKTKYGIVKVCGGKGKDNKYVDLRNDKEE